MCHSIMALAEHNTSNWLHNCSLTLTAISDRYCIHRQIDCMPYINHGLPCCLPTEKAHSMRTSEAQGSPVKLVPFRADSENRTPLLATMPTGSPYNLPKPVTSVAPYCFLNSSNLDPSSSLASTALTSQGFLESAGTIPAHAFLITNEGWHMLSCELVGRSQQRLHRAALMCAPKAVHKHVLWATDMRISFLLSCAEMPKPCLRWSRSGLWRLICHRQLMQPPPVFHAQSMNNC